MTEGLLTGQFGLIFHCTRTLTMKNVLPASARGLWTGCGLAGLLMVGGTVQAMEFSDVVMGTELRFLAQRPDPEGYWYESRVSIASDSLQSGVVDLATCHHQLDPIHRIVIAFNAERVQHIEVVSSHGVAQADVVGKRVELRDVTKGASVCLHLRSRALDRNDDGTWRLHAGPLMRRYLDGYLPMRAHLSFSWPKGMLTLARTEPAEQTGVVVSGSDEGARMDITFAGRMRATLDLASAASTTAR